MPYWEEPVACQPAFRSAGLLACWSCWSAGLLVCRSAGFWPAGYAVIICHTASARPKKLPAAVGIYRRFLSKIENMSVIRPSFRNGTIPDKRELSKLFNLKYYNWIWQTSTSNQMRTGY
jgi:hypothetical protein